MLHGVHVFTLITISKEILQQRKYHLISIFAPFFLENHSFLSTEVNPLRL